MSSDAITVTKFSCKSTEPTGSTGGSAHGTVPENHELSCSQGSPNDRELFTDGERLPFVPP